MATVAQPRRSFSPYRKWRMALHVVLIVCLVMAVVGMVNFLSRDFFLRFNWSPHGKIELAPLTVSFLRSLTNQVRVIVYYDKKDTFYSTIADLLNQYQLTNPKISVETVDYLLDAGAAQKVSQKYKLSSAGEKNVIIFDCEGKSKVVDGNTLAKYVLEQDPSEKEPTYRRKPAEFLGQKLFTAALLWVTSPKPLRACFLQGHGEHAPESTDEVNGYVKLAAVLQQNCLELQRIKLLGTNPAPSQSECDLLVIAGPTDPIPDLELEKIDQYLNQGGRLLVLFRYKSVAKQIGLEKVLAKWGVDVGYNVVEDPDHTISGQDVIVEQFSNHPLVNGLLLSSLHLLLPRSISRLAPPAQAADAPRVEEIAFSGPRSYLNGDKAHRQAAPLMVAVEKGIKGVVTERGTTRMIVVGDSIFLANHQIDSARNRDFAAYAVNWLLDRTQLLGEIGPQPVSEYRLLMSAAQMRKAEWVLLAAAPGGVLLVGGLVWLRRRR